MDQVGFPVPTTALRALVGASRGEALPAERLGRVLGYERQRFLGHRGAPRIAVAITPDARPARPQHLVNPDWRFYRRILCEDARPGMAAALGVRLCQRAQEVPQACDLLWPPIQDAAGTALKWAAASPDDLPALYSKFLQVQPHAVGSPTQEQWNAEKTLQAQHISGLVQYFGSDDAVAKATARSTIRAPQPGEFGEALDDLVRRRAGNSSIAREVLAFVQEWGRAADDLHKQRIDRVATIEDYIERWKVSEREAQERLRLFIQIFPNEDDPGALWRLLWDMVPATEAGSRPAFVRLTSQPVIVESAPPTLAAYFLDCLYEQLPRRLGARLHSSGIRPRVEVQDSFRDLQRLYKLADRATHKWAVLALETEGQQAEASLRGLRSLWRIEDIDSAEVAEQAIGGYRQRASERGPRSVLLNAQKCLRVCAEFSPLDTLSAVTPLLPGARYAATSLAALCVLGAVDVVEEINVTMEALHTIS